MLKNTSNPIILKLKGDVIEKIKYRHNCPRRRGKDDAY